MPKYAICGDRTPPTLEAIVQILKHIDRTIVGNDSPVKHVIIAKLVSLKNLAAKHKMRITVPKCILIDWVS